jgi:sulfatase modifying factor 1
VVNATTVTAMTPAGTLGNADVVITGGKGTITVVGGYRYVTVVVPSWATLVEAQPDPAVVTNANLREAIVATGLAWRVRDTATQVEMLLISPGTFQMGCNMGSDGYGCTSLDEQPVHAVTLTSAFYLGRYEVTQSQWVQTIGWNPSYFQGYPDSDVRPVETIFWSTVQSYLSASSMRLPTEAEWEYACRAGTQTPFYNGSANVDTLVDLAWILPNSGQYQTHAVGGKAPNAFGLYDMLGNVWEWVNDWYSSSYYSVSPMTNPPGPLLENYRVRRGGSATTRGYSTSSSVRGYSSPNGGGNFMGFRVARNP